MEMAVLASLILMTFPVTMAFLPFELNPDMPPGGQDITEHLTQKYGSTPEQQAQIGTGLANLITFILFVHVYGDPAAPPSPATTAPRFSR